MSEPQSTVERDEYGYLRDPDQWSPALAQELAQERGIAALTSQHWEIIQHLRRHYLEHGTLVWMEHTCHAVGLEDDCLHRLFQGPDSAWRIAGLPDPGEEARTYLRNEEPPG